MNDSEEWRRETEARYVAAMDDERQQEFYKGVFQNRGQEKTEQLIADVELLKNKK